MIYQLAPHPVEAFSPAYTVLPLIGLPRVDAYFPDPHIQLCMAEYVGMWYVWKFEAGHEWVGFTSYNQLAKNKSRIIFRDKNAIPGLLNVAPFDMVSWYWQDWGNSWDLRSQAELCHPGINDSCKLVLGHELPELRAGPYANYFAMRWDDFDQYMRWSWPIMESMIATCRSHPCFTLERGRASSFCGLMERLLIIWQHQRGKQWLILA